MRKTVSKLGRFRLQESHLLVQNTINFAHTPINYFDVRVVVVTVGHASIMHIALGCTPPPLLFFAIVGVFMEYYPFVGKNDKFAILLDGVLPPSTAGDRLFYPISAFYT